MTRDFGRKKRNSEGGGGGGGGEEYDAAGPITETNRYSIVKVTVHLLMRSFEPKGKSRKDLEREERIEAEKLRKKREKGAGRGRAIKVGGKEV